MTRKDELSEVQMKALESFADVWEHISDHTKLQTNAKTRRIARNFYVAAFQRGASYMAMEIAGMEFSECSKMLAEHLQGNV